MNKLKIVKDHLNSNSKVKVVRIKEETYFPIPSGFWTQFVEIYVAPSSGLYDSKKLQEFMMKELVPPDLEPTSVDNFYTHQFHDGGRLELGSLYFDEEIGKKIEHAEIYDEELLNKIKSDFPVEEKNNIITKKEKLERRTLVRLYPTEDVAEDVISWKHPEFRYWIPLKELEKYIFKESKEQFE